MYIYIYIYIERERERERGKPYIRTPDTDSLRKLRLQPKLVYLFSKMNVYFPAIPGSVGEEVVLGAPDSSKKQSANSPLTFVQNIVAKCSNCALEH